MGNRLGLLRSFRLDMVVAKHSRCDLTTIMIDEMLSGNKVILVSNKIHAEDITEAVLSDGRITKKNIGDFFKFMTFIYAIDIFTSESMRKVVDGYVDNGRQYIFTDIEES